MEEEFSKIRDGFKHVFQVEIFHVKRWKLNLFWSYPKFEWLNYITISQVRYKKRAHKILCNSQKIYKDIFKSFLLIFILSLFLDRLFSGKE